MSISIGMVGVGSLGESSIPLFKQHPDVSRIARCDLNEERMAERLTAIGGQA